MKVHLIANMYPSKQHPNYGVFVENTEKILAQSGVAFDRTVVTKQSSSIGKLMAYGSHFFKVIGKSLFRKYDVTYVHYATHNSIPVLIAKKLNKNMVIYTNVHGSDVVPEFKKRQKYQPYVKRLLEVSDTVITPSAYYKELVQQKYGLTNRIEIFPSGGINKQTFHEKETTLACQELEINPAYSYIGFVGRIDRGKGWDVYLKAAELLKEQGKLGNCKLLFIGDGLEKEDFESMVDKFGLRDHLVHFPLLSQQKLNSVYNSMAVFCFPTMREGESLGLVGLEAMACGTPVIGSCMAGLLDYMEDGRNGFLFEPGSAEALADSIKSYMELPEEAKQSMREAAMQTASAYEVEAIKPRLTKIFSV
ncbi:Glycosyltransferase involved in cell wall bisynthesis [Terribacillus halophilus]|uniref:Glycosyltransferase involved in cell wall bisynthesis n=1 Tax=Terribacillus halophilus TaxID=361279 RepID=A0A1G6IGQ5_9BACI|nr:glycosyltransferase [Terribacillus halophilus]SDC04916.1 Glycosyltransferase involved in cell wall bisynthesis [Terribacillus halophilus]